jgi:hypothetical protein
MEPGTWNPEFVPVFYIQVDKFIRYELPVNHYLMK